MAQKKITSLDSLMIFTGSSANLNAKALEDRNYNDYDNSIIGKLFLTSEFDSAFSLNDDEIFVETTPKYKSFKDITAIAYAYINNRSVIKPTKDSEMYIDNEGSINFLYNYETHLEYNLDKAKIVPSSDIKLYLTSLNNSMFNKQRYYSKSKEVYDLSNYGVKFNWLPAGSYLNLYDEEKEEDYKLNVGNDYLTYLLNIVKVQATTIDPTTGNKIYLTDSVAKYDDITYTYTYTDVPRMINKNILVSSTSYLDIVNSFLSDSVDNFKTTKDSELLSYYIYDLNDCLNIVADTYTFGQQKIDVKINYDGEFNNWFHNRISFNVDNLESTELLKIVPAQNYWFNIVKDENVRFLGEDIRSNSPETFSLKDLEVNKFNNLSILSPYKLKRIDFSPISDKLVGELDLLCDYDKKINYKDTVRTNWLKEKGSLLEELIIGKEGVNCMITSIKGIEQFTNLKKLDLTGCINLSSNPDLSGLENINDYILTGTNVSVFNPAPGSFINSAILGESIESIILNDITFKNENSLIFDVSDKLYSIEINNVRNLNSYKLIRNWVNALKEAGKLDGDKAGTVNYVNITDVKWICADYRVLFDLAKIELDKFTGVINVWGDSDIIYRQDYRKMIDVFGIDNINNSESDLNLIIKVGENAFKTNVLIEEDFTDYREEINDFGETITVEFTNIRKWKDLVINVEDTVTGNSFIDSILSNTENFTRFTLSKFINNNREQIGLSFSLPQPLELPLNSENPEELHKGEIYLYGQNTLIFITEDSKNINQNFTRIGNIENIQLFDDYLINQFEGKNYLTLTSMEDEIFGPDEDNVIDVEYGDLKDINNIEVEYGEISPRETNLIKIEYTKPTI